MNGGLGRTPVSVDFMQCLANVWSSGRTSIFIHLLPLFNEWSSGRKSFLIDDMRNIWCMKFQGIQELGVGISINSDEDIYPQLESALKDLEENNESYLQNIEHIRQSFALSNTPDEAVLAIESLFDQISNNTMNQSTYLIGNDARSDLI